MAFTSPKIKTLVSNKLGWVFSNRKVRSVPLTSVAAYGVKRVNGKTVTKSCAAVIYPQAHNNYPLSCYFHSWLLFLSAALMKGWHLHLAVLPQPSFLHKHSWLLYLSAALMKGWHLHLAVLPQPSFLHKHSWLLFLSAAL